MITVRQVRGRTVINIASCTRVGCFDGAGKLKPGEKLFGKIASKLKEGIYTDDGKFACRFENYDPLKRRI